MHYLAAKLPRPAGDAYVSLVVEKDKYEGGTWLSIIEVKPMTAGLVTVNAQAMANDITGTGHVAIYGIYFDTGKAAIKPESKPVLDEIAKLLATQSALKLHVVGHTDNVGSLGSNMTLSKQRAEAVVNALVNEYRVAATRLQPNGVGPLAPVASNAAEDGRAKNRRVELVAQ
jgi:outer membrane protein OmpA-like peptidoglycan-associated protein